MKKGENMCLGCLVASMGLAYDSEEAQEFIQQAIGTDGGYHHKVYGQITATYSSSNEGDDCEECSSCQSVSYDTDSPSVNEYSQPVMNY